MHTFLFRVLRRIGQPAMGTAFPRDGEKAVSFDSAEGHIAAQDPLIAIDASGIFGGSDAIAQGVHINGFWFVPAASERTNQLETEFAEVSKPATT